MLITPAEAFFPNNVLCGPRRTSILSSNGKSEIWDCMLERYTPSINNATEGSTPGLFDPFPNPLIKKVALVDDWYCLVSNEGTTDLRSNISVIPAFSIVSAFTTETATGTSCNVFSVFVAVTIISSTL